MDDIVLRPEMSVVGERENLIPLGSIVLHSVETNLWFDRDYEDYVGWHYEDMGQHIRDTDPWPIEDIWDSGICDKIRAAVNLDPIDRNMKSNMDVW